MGTKAWVCSKCGTVVFIPDDAGVDGGVCTQQRGGCSGEIELMGEEAARRVRAMLPTHGLREQPWLTLVFGPPVAKPVLGSPGSSGRRGSATGTAFTSCAS